MTTKTTITISALLIVIVALAGVILWNRLPEQMASHWNEQDQVDGYMSKFWGVFMVPLLMTGLSLLFLAIPHIDPLKKNIAAFRGVFNIFIVLFNVFMAFIHALTLAWNLGHTGFRMGVVLLPAMGLLFIFIGFLIRKAKRNFFIGIRTPWTLSSDKVWDETHRLGSKLFIAAGVITFVGILFPDQAFILLMVSVIAASLISVIYSYLVFRQEEKKAS
jgi:uncharacterized membrane protein